MIRSSKPTRGGLISRAALGAALALGTLAGGAMISTPAMAAKKEPKPAPLKLSPEFQKQAGPVQAALEAARAKPGGDVTALKTQVEQLLAVASTPDDKYVAGQFAVSLGGIAKDQALQRKGVLAMLESGKSPAEEAAKLNVYAGQFALQAKDYAAARTALQAAIQGGYTGDDAHVLLAEAYLGEGNTRQGLDMLQQAIDRQQAKGPVDQSWYRRGLLAAYNAKSGPQASKFGAGLVQNYPTPANWGIAITIVREIGGIPSQEMVDLLRLMGRTNSYNEPRDYLEYIEAADPRKLPGEVLKIIEAGTAKMNKNGQPMLSPSDPTVRDARAIATERVGPDKASLPTLEKDARAPSATAVTALASGDAFLSYGEAAKAEALYTIALGKPGVDQARALTRLGIAQADQGKYAEAQATFAKITGPRKPIADLWSAYVAGKTKAPATASAQ
jgi:tetratricopeptide (TPR) repeat protein